MPYKYIFFDLDGTLIDPKVGITKGVQYALNKFGIAEDLEKLTHFIGPPLNKSFQKFYGFDEKKSMEGVNYYREYFLSEGIHKNTLYPGIVELLAKLKQENKKLYVVTSKPTDFAEKIIKYHKLESYFEKIIGPRLDLSNADKTILINETLALFPEEKNKSVVMIGDREHDIIGAKNNYIDSIGILYGYGSEEEIANANPTHIAKTVEDLEKYL